MDFDQQTNFLREEFRQELIRAGGIFEDIFRLSEEISRLRFYLNTLEEFISTEEKVEIDQLERRTQSLSDEQRGEFWSWNYPVYWDEIFRDILRSSFLISLVSFTEKWLNMICHNTAIIVSSKITSSDLKGSVLERSRKFLEIFGGFMEPVKDKWDLIAHIYDVRNVFVHNGGSILQYRDQKRLSRFIENQPGLSLSNDFINIKGEFCFFLPRKC
jgi:hypothetical protein